MFKIVILILLLASSCKTTNVRKIRVDSDSIKIERAIEQTLKDYYKISRP